MNIREIKQEGSKAVFDTPQGRLLIEAMAPALVRVCIGAKDGYVSPTGIGAESARGNSLRGVHTQEPAWRCGEDDQAFTLSTALLRLSINKANGRLDWYDSGGNLLLSQPHPELTREPVIKYRGGGLGCTEQTANGERGVGVGLVPYEDRTAYRAKVFTDFQKDERLHGLGQAEEGVYDYKGKNQYLYQHNQRIPIPFLLSDKGYGLLFDCGCLLTFNDGGFGSYMFLDTVEALDFYFIHGENTDRIIAGMRRLTGRASLLPKWAFGYMQSKEAYRTQDELVEIAREYRRRHIPLDCVIQDWNTWESGKWGNKRLDKARYPDITTANRELHGMNVHSMVSVWPTAGEKSEDYLELQEAGFLLQDGRTYNALDPKARRLYWEQARRELFSGGFDSWWCDSTEPFEGPDWNGPVMREPWERFCLVGGEHKKFLDPAWANLFALEHARGIYENQRLETGEKRVFNLTRSGWAGSQRYGAALWSGDITARWDTLQKQIHEGLNFCMSGLPWWTLDIGGFFCIRDDWDKRRIGNMASVRSHLWFWSGDFEDGLDDPAYRELYVRWLQLGTFLPLFRSHGTDTPREIWRFGEPGTVFYDAIETFIRLRYRLMPYIYSLAGATALRDYTMMRSLLFDFDADETAKDTGDQFMFGNALMVCPVTEPMYHLPRRRPGFSLRKKQDWNCYLPGKGNRAEGAKPVEWYDYWTGERYAGGQHLTVPAPLEKIPLFVRAGSIIPRETAKIEYAAQISEEPMEIRIYPGADGRFVLYEDSGDGYGYEEGICNQVELRWDDKKHVLYIGPSEFDFPQSLRRRGCVVRDGTGMKRIAYRGEALEVDLSTYDIGC